MSYYYPYHHTDITITAYYGVRYLNNSKLHIGLDMYGQTDKRIYAVGGGKVTKAKANKTGYGTHVIIAQDDGVTALYAHLSAMTVKAGQRVEAGQQIGVQGSTGNSTGPHLHLEMYRGAYKYPAKDTLGTTLDPLAYLKLPPRTKVFGQPTDARLLEALKARGVLTDLPLWERYLTGQTPVDPRWLRVAFENLLEKEAR